MFKRRIAVILGLLALATAGVLFVAIPASAHTLHQGGSYGCQINPNQPQCQIKSTPVVPTPQIPPQLPPTGGGQPAPQNGIGLALLAGMLVALGFGLTRAGRRL